MKKFFTLIISVPFYLVTILAQSPQKMSYQAVVRDVGGKLVTNQAVGIRISILQGSATGTEVFKETYNPIPKTNANGLVNLEVGSGVALTGTFNAINWASGPYFLKTETDPMGGTNYTITAASQLLSVPYALYSQSSGSTVDSIKKYAVLLYGDQGISGNKTFSSDVTISNLTMGNGNGHILSNTALGYTALFSNTTGNFNSATGIRSLYSNTEGTHNTASGSSSLFKNTTGNFNAAFGSSSLLSNTTGSENTAHGYSSLYYNTSGSYNTAIGSNALASNTTGNYSTAIGYYSLYFNTTGTNNIANGAGALYYNTTGNDNTAIGRSALQSNTTGSFNTANGSGSLFSNTIGVGNTANGGGSLYTNTTGNYNTADGINALQANTAGSRNTAVGHFALNSNTSGDHNTAIGSDALTSNTTGSENTAIGFGTLTGSYTGTQITVIGSYANVTANLVNATAIGAYATVSANNRVVIGNSSVTSIGGYANWTNYSDRRLKENIVYKNGLGLQFINKLQTVAYNYKADINKRRRDGLIAQDVDKILKEMNLEFSGLVIDDDKDKTMNLAYGDFVLPLINAVQELSKQNAEMKAEIAALKASVDTLLKK